MFNQDNLNKIVLDKTVLVKKFGVAELIIKIFLIQLKKINSKLNYNIKNKL